MTSLRPNRPRHRLATAARVVVGAGILVAGVLSAGAFTSSAPAAPQDCLPVVGCVTTVVTTLPLPGVTVPTLPGTTTATGTVPPTTPSTASTISTSTTTPTTASPGAARFSPKATIRVRGRGARRLIEIRVTLTKAARLNALLSRRRGVIAQRLFTATAGPHLFRLRIGRAVKPGLANLSLVYRATTGESAHTTHRLWLPR